MAERLFRAAHEARAKSAQDAGARGFPVDLALPTSMGLSAENFRSLMKDAGFRPGQAVDLPEGTYGPPRPLPWSWRAPRKDAVQARPPRPSRPKEDRPKRDRAKMDRAKMDRDGRPKDDRKPHGKERRGPPPAPREPREPGEKRDTRPPAYRPATGKAFAGLADLLKR
jgi:ATP-dependent RNA helicase SUPV3L1/SUV3